MHLDVCHTYIAIFYAIKPFRTKFFNESKIYFQEKTKRCRHVDKNKMGFQNNLIQKTLYKLAKYHNLLVDVEMLPTHVATRGWAESKIMHNICQTFFSLTRLCNLTLLPLTKVISKQKVAEPMHGMTNTRNVALPHCGNLNEKIKADFRSGHQAGLLLRRYTNSVRVSKQSSPISHRWTGLK